MYQSVEKTSEFLEDFFLQTGVRLETFGFLPFFECLTFFFCKSFRDIYTYVYQQVTCSGAVAVAVDVRQTFASQTQNLTRLCSRFNLDFGLAVYCRDFHCTTKRCLRNAKKQIINKVAFVSYRRFRLLSVQDAFLLLSGQAGRLPHRCAFRHYPYR